MTATATARTWRAARWNPNRRARVRLLAWLAAHPDAEAVQAARALGWSVYRAHRHLNRLERDGRVKAYTVQDEFFAYVVYRAHP